MEMFLAFDRETEREREGEKCNTKVEKIDDEENEEEDDDNSKWI